MSVSRLYPWFAVENLPPEQILIYSAYIADRIIFDPTY